MFPEDLVNVIAVYSLLVDQPASDELDEVLSETIALLLEPCSLAGVTMDDDDAAYWAQWNGGAPGLAWEPWTLSGAQLDQIKKARKGARPVDDPVRDRIDYGG